MASVSGFWVSVSYIRRKKIKLECWETRMKTTTLTSSSFRIRYFWKLSYLLLLNISVRKIKQTGRLIDLSLSAWGKKSCNKLNHCDIVT